MPLSVTMHALQRQILIPNISIDEYDIQLEGFPDPRPAFVFAGHCGVEVAHA